MKTGTAMNDSQAMVAQSAKLAKEARAKQRWIPVSERIPDSDCTVLIACADGNEPVWIGFHNGEEWVTVEGATVSVTHWQDFPESPEGAFNPAQFDADLAEADE